MNLVLESLQMLCLVLYYWLESIYLSIIPASVRGKDVSGETVLITGAASGIGRLLAKRFANLGCRLVLWDINKEANETTAKEIRKQGVTVRTYRVDLSNQKDIFAAADKVRTEVGQVDILVNNAGIVSGKKFLECSDEMVRKTMDVNVMAHFWTVKAFLPTMMKRDHGHVINIASSAGLIGVNGLADYCASKFAVVGFNESLQFELDSLGKTGVNTTLVCPYLVNTGMFDGCQAKFPWILPMLLPEEVADGIIEAFLCNQRVVYLPKLLYFFLALKGFLPTKCLFLICNFMGANSMMDTFKGRTK
ncbi:hypothetical protein SNE40_006075 [Patella caerulea]|uniref:Uncharacterized protein n=1 Tax=Patella caerulea TaxID=87958 RepID=A0AAN8K1N0_PATCE